MAIVADGFALSVTIADSAGDKSTLSYDLTSADHLTAVSDAAAIIAALDNVTASIVVNYDIRTKYVENAFTYPTGADNAIKASMTVNLVTPGKRANLQIPAPVSAVFQDTSGPGFNIVDGTAAGVTAYVALFQAAGQATISDGEVVSATPGIQGRRTASKVTLTGQR